MNKLFGDIKLTWLKLILFSVVVGVVVGIIMIIPAFYDSAFRNVGATYEMWIVLAIFVVSNTHKPLEAGLKCFVFFLISQPIIYLVQQPFTDVNLIARYYFPWFIQTILCLPGGMIAYQIKKENILGSIILSVATSFVCFTGLMYIYEFFKNLNLSYLLSGIFYVAIVIFFIIRFGKSKKNIIVASLLTVLISVSLLSVYIYKNSEGTRVTYTLDESHDWTLSYSTDGSFKADIEEGHVLVVEYKKKCECELTCTNENDEEVVVRFVYDSEPIFTIID